MESTTVITRNCAIAAGCAMQHDTGYRADSASPCRASRRAGLAAGLVTREALPTLAGQRRASGRHSGALPGFRPVADVPGLPAGLVTRASVADFPTCRRCAGQRRASGRHSGSARKRARGLPCPCESETLARLRPSLPCGACGALIVGRRELDSHCLVIRFGQLRQDCLEATLVIAHMLQPIPQFVGGVLAVEHKPP